MKLLCTRTFRRSAAGAAALALTLGLPATSASAEASQPAEPVTEFHTLTLPVELKIGAGRFVVDGVDALRQTLDDTGAALTGLTSTKLRTSAVMGNGTPRISNFACVQNGKANKDFTTYAPRDLFYASDLGVLQFLIETYEQRAARRIHGKPRTQVQLCSTGGADLAGGWKAKQSGVGLFLADSSTTHKIGQQWQAGKNPGDVEQSLGFQLGAKRGSVEIGASLSQGAGDFLAGSFTGPYPTDLDAFARNGTAGWWQDGCVDGWTKCKAPKDGQDSFRGSIAQGLWEFTPKEYLVPHTFYVVPYLSYKCGKWRGGCK